MRRTDACPVAGGSPTAPPRPARAVSSAFDRARGYKPASRSVVGHWASMPPGEVVGSIASGR
jgi:hypothetical protein